MWTYSGVVNVSGTGCTALTAQATFTPDIGLLTFGQDTECVPYLNSCILAFGAQWGAIGTGVYAAFYGAGSNVVSKSGTCNTPGPAYYLTETCQFNIV